MARLMQLKSMATSNLKLEDACFLRNCHELTIEYLKGVFGRKEQLKVICHNSYQNHK